MRLFEFYKLDVFTHKKFSGNQLAVFPNAEGITDVEMQSIANEMNLSETVFVLPSADALRSLRIFTPQQELPLAGHPVVGTWNLLAHLGVTPQIEKGSVNIKQELNLGVLPVEIEFRDNNPFRVVMTQGEFQTFETISDESEITRFANGLGLQRENLVSQNDLPIQVVSTGVKAVVVPIETLEQLGAIRINSSLLSENYEKYNAVGVFAYTFETIEDKSSVHARFFAPADGIPEDPATGSASGSLSGYLVYHGAIDKTQFVIEQGDFMNRPSRIYADVSGEKGNIKLVKIGGSSVIVAKGEVFLD